MRLDIFIFISTSCALLIPRCETGDHAVASSSTSVTTPPLPPYTKKIKTSTISSVITTTPSLATRVASAESSCRVHSICADFINPCGKRYGACFDENFCDGNTSPYPIPACPTMVTKKREAIADPVVTQS